MKDFKRFIFYHWICINLFTSYFVLSTNIRNWTQKNIKFEFNFERISQNMIYLTKTIMLIECI